MSGAKVTNELQRFATFSACDFFSIYCCILEYTPLEMERINVEDLTPEHLFNNHVSKRKPLVISGVPTDASFKAFEKWVSRNTTRSTARQPSMYQD